jgi:ketol-acid reductoisomerase
MLVQRHLKDYLETEVKYGHSEKSYREAKINSVKECLEILERLQKDKYNENALNEVYSKYPKYKQLITKHSDGCTSYSGEFIALGNGWAGIEAGANPRRGYFECVNGKFELTTISDKSVQAEIEQRLDQIERYHADWKKAIKNSDKCMEDDKRRLGELLNQHFFSWWD